MSTFEPPDPQNRSMLSPVGPDLSPMAASAGPVLPDPNLVNGPGQGTLPPPTPSSWPPAAPGGARPAPVTATATAAGPVKAPPNADFVQRLVGYLVDGVVLAVVLTPAYVATALVFGFGHSSPVLRFLAGAASFLLLVAPFAYYGVLEGRGQTPGKRLAKTATVDARTGEPVGTVRSLGRLFARTLSATPFYLGYLWMLWDPDQATWHDKISSTRVISLR